MKKDFKSLKEEAAIKAELDYASDEGESNSEKDDDDPKPVRSSWLDCFLDLVRQVFGFNRESKKLFSSEPTDDNNDENIFAIITSKHQQVTD